MASEREIFSLTGPSFLTALDWNNSHHRRSVAASLVQGVYTLERDRRGGRHGPHALAPPWWHSLNFKLVQILVDSHEVSHFGAVYEYLHFHHYLNTGQRPPRYVIAFRGTINKTGNREEDFKLNLHLIINNLHNSSRFQTGIDAVRGVVHHAGPANVWVAGHSLGSSLALLAGREMAKHSGVHLETYLFNPPFASPPIQRLANDRLRLGLRLANSVLTAGLAAAVDYADRRNNNNKIKEDDHFSILSSWIPYLFINPSDPICSEYSGYFKHREDMEAIGAGRIGRIATKHSISSVVLSAAGKKECEAVHLIPSAYLTVNVTPSRDFKEAHGIHQWWRQDLVFDYKYYQHKSNSHQRRSVAASLVQGVYSLERDRRENRQGAQALAPPWWEHFNFKLVQILVDNHDLSIFGAVLEFVDFPHCLHHQRPPHYVVAFRGTIPKAGNREEDFKLDLHLVINNLRSSSRFQIGIETAAQIVTHVGAGNVWLAGHSLGSSMALVVGREMVKQFGIHLETYLFNSPFISPPIERLGNDKIKLGVRLMNSVITAGFAAAAEFAGGKKNKDVEADPFEVLSTWIPYLFINPSDPISMEYVGYFKHREDMEAIGAGRIGRLATKNSIGTILSCAAGQESEAVHLIPSAYLTINVTPLEHFREAHGLYQWWRQDLQFDYKYYQLK